VWGDTLLRLAGVEAGLTWRNVLTLDKMTVEVQDGVPTVAVGDVLASFPVALLMAEAG
jgi:hypothetical protein